MTPMNDAVFLLDVDNKLRILAAMKKTWGDRLTTVFPRTGRRCQTYVCNRTDLSAHSVYKGTL